MLHILFGSYLLGRIAELCYHASNYQGATASLIGCSRNKCVEWSASTGSFRKFMIVSVDF